MIHEHDNADTAWANEDVEHPAEFWDNLPKPILWRMIVMPIKPVEKTKSGIVIPVQAQEAQQYLTFTGKVVGMGGCAYKSERFAGETNFPKIGEHVMYGRYAGQPMVYRGVKLLILNDDEILGTVADPSSLKVHI